jgi:hypothetical protein
MKRLGLTLLLLLAGATAAIAQQLDLGAIGQRGRCCGGHAARKKRTALAAPPVRKNRRRLNRLLTICA